MFDPFVDVDDIQGNVLGGFRHAHRLLIYGVIGDDTVARRMVRALAERVTVARDTVRRDAAQPPVAVNAAFSFALLRRLAPDSDLFTDPAFRAGLATRSPLLGDPVVADAKGSACNWVVGGRGREADVVLVVGADDERLLDGVKSDYLAVGDGVTVIHEDRGTGRFNGRTLREHFGFADGIAQPGVRGRFVDQTGTTSLLLHEVEGRLARVGEWTDVVWPGEFVFGYPGQSRTDASAPGPDRLESSAPPWARNGSYLVIRRLHQDVGALHRFVHETAVRLSLSPSVVAARMLGRWPSGAPLARYAADPGDAFDPEAPAAHDFAYGHDDPLGRSCPVSAHTRKVHPRGVNPTDGQTLPCLPDTQRRRLLRRGVPYGSPSASSVDAPLDDGVDRGLLFAAYQTSIEDQFEFVVRRWANEANFPEPISGHDPIIGQNSHRRDRQRAFQVDAGWAGRVTTDREWVVPTGGGYFFAPGRRGLYHLAHAARPKVR